MSFLLTTEQTIAIQRATKRGLKQLYQPEPIGLLEWAEKHFYLSKESSYVEGMFEALEWQRAILNVISHDDVRIVDWIKSARVGASKIELAAAFYFLEHRQRNVGFYHPNDEEAKEFSKGDIDPALRDCNVMHNIFPWLGKKSPKNTEKYKEFLGATLRNRGGKAAGNYRRISLDVVIYEELEAFDKDIEKEGDPITLADKRIEGSLFPKSLRFTTPSLEHGSLIGREVKRANYFFKYEVPCPHCNELQELKWGEKGGDYGMVWDKDRPETVKYQCEHCHCLIDNSQLPWMNAHGQWIDRDKGVTVTQDGHFFTLEGKAVPVPRHVAFHIWAAYNPLVNGGWASLVHAFIEAMQELKEKNDITLYKTFVNTTLGLTWKDEASEQLDYEILFNKRERYPTRNGQLALPREALAVYAGLDTQDDRIECAVRAFGLVDGYLNSWLIDYWVLTGNPSQPELWEMVAKKLSQSYLREDGAELPIRRACQDSGGHYTDEVHKLSRKVGATWLYPTRGAPEYGKPFINVPRVKDKVRKTYLVHIGTDTAKEALFNQIELSTKAVDNLIHGKWHWPEASFCDETYFKQLCAEEKVLVRQKGKLVAMWSSKGRRNEALDCEILAHAAFQIDKQRFGFTLENARANPSEGQPQKTSTAELAAKLNSGT